MAASWLGTLSLMRARKSLRAGRAVAAAEDEEAAAAAAPAPAPAASAPPPPLLLACVVFSRFPVGGGLDAGNTLGGNGS